MAINSPGVEVTVTDESFYVPADQGMVPAIVVASAKNKTSGTGTGTAAGTFQPQRRALGSLHWNS